ncbi:hypothetical protein DL96DRAFT_1815364 [Flagelloscypha sp. PMI_526]|nr:hypothetical protein DL96DRAFT_1815364 [Flagelloscypha sp. PMI_526]
MALPYLILAISILYGRTFSFPLADRQEIEVESSLRHRCGTGYCNGANFMDPKYLCGDARLGPKVLPGPRFDPIDDVVGKYHRLGGLCPDAFLSRWFNTTTGYYNYPPENGFQLSTSGQPIHGKQYLGIGSRLDRFGSEFGFFLAPAGSPFSQRALPPSNLDWPEDALPRIPYNYHVYEVTREFEVMSGPIAPWFGQPGQGTQYQTFSNIMTLIQDGFLEPISITYD